MVTLDMVALYSQGYQFCVWELPKVRCTGLEFILEGWVRMALTWRGSPTFKKKEKGKNFTFGSKYIIFIF
jgi:hypothetical protein